MSLAPSPFYKKTITFPFAGYTYLFNVSQELFSSQSVDIGTQRLLRSLLYEKIHNRCKILDLGCGYGPLGIILKKLNSKAQVHFVDRDALALEFAQQNAELNKNDKDLTFYASLGYDSVTDSDFDLIVSNIPAKVGEKVLRHFLQAAQFHLAKNGRVAVVVVDALADFVEQELRQDENIDVLYHRAWPGHQVFHYRFIAKPAEAKPLGFATGDYQRQAMNYSFAKDTFQLNTTYHLPEFDQPSYETKLLLASLNKLREPMGKVAIIYPGQGYLPVVIAKIFQPLELVLIDRDLQALKTSQENVQGSGGAGISLTLYHQAEWEIERINLDAVFVVLPEKLTAEAYHLFLQQVHEMLRAKGMLLVSSTSTTIKRLESLLDKEIIFGILSTNKDKGKSVVLLRKI